jgi:hypothetical protein
MVKDGFVQFLLPAREAEITLATGRTMGWRGSILQCRRRLIYIMSSATWRTMYLWIVHDQGSKGT